MRFVYRISGFAILVGLFLAIYGCLTFNLNRIVLGLILLWMGTAIFGQFMEADRIRGEVGGNHTS